MQVDFKKELESASKSMIMIHDPRLLIKLIIRMIVRKLKISHAGMLLLDPKKDTYVLSISKGPSGVKIPEGYTRFNFDSPIVKIFTKEEYRLLTLDRNALVSHDINKLLWKEDVIENGNGTKDLLHKVDDQMQMLNTVACVPAYYRNKLLAVLLLGEKDGGAKFDQDELNFFAALASDAAMAIRNAQLFDDLKSEAERNRKLYLQTITVLGATIEAKDAYTHGHTERVTDIGVMIARQMVKNGSAEFKEDFYENLYIAGVLHDIGKIAIPEAILNKNKKLTDEEYELMKTHTVKGAEMLKPLNLPKETMDGVLYHHEFFNGKGYPEGLKGAEIPISAGIVSVADAFDAMTTDRPYRKALPTETAIAEINRHDGSQFNPLAAKALMELYEEGRL